MLIGPRLTAISSVTSVAVLAFLILYALVQPCSFAAMSLFIFLFSISAVLAFTGIISGALVYRKTRNRLAFLRLPLGLVYAAGLLVLLSLA